MQGLMMDYPLTLQHPFNRAIHLYARTEIVTQTEGEPGYESFLSANSCSLLPLRWLRVVFLAGPTGCVLPEMVFCPQPVV